LDISRYVPTTGLPHPPDPPRQGRRRNVSCQEKIAHRFLILEPGVQRFLAAFIVAKAASTVCGAIRDGSIVAFRRRQPGSHEGCLLRWDLRAGVERRRPSHTGRGIRARFGLRRWRRGDSLHAARRCPELQPLQQPRRRGGPNEKRKRKAKGGKQKGSVHFSMFFTEGCNNQGQVDSPFPRADLLGRRTLMFDGIGATTLESLNRRSRSF